MKRMCFIKSEVEGEIYAMKKKISTNKILASTSLVFGILSLFSFVLYFYSANHAPYGTCFLDDCFNDIYSDCWMFL